MNTETINKISVVTQATGRRRVSVSSVAQDGRQRRRFGVLLLHLYNESLQLL